MCYHPFYFPWFGLFFFVILLLFIFRGRHWHHRWGGPYYSSHWEKSPEDILAERFAKGEIDEKEYNERMAVLKQRKP